MANTIKLKSDQAGSDNFKKVKSILVHSAEDCNKISFKTCKKGLNCSILPNSAIQFATPGGAKYCNQTCLEDNIMPIILKRKMLMQYKVRAMVFPLYIAPMMKAQKIAHNAYRCKRHKGHGTKLNLYSRM
jgi:hypothetical protein